MTVIARSCTSPRVLLAMTLVGLSLVGCSEERPANGWSGSIDTLPDGSIAVHNPATGAVLLDSLWRVEVVARIGTLEGSGPEAFASISELEVDGHQRVWVVESQAREVRVFGPDGTHVRTIGRPGGGPGEFERPTGISRSPTGEMWVMDVGNARISVFDTAGNYITAHRRRSAGYSIPCRCGFSDGRYHDFAFLSDGPGLLRFDPEMASADSLAVPERPGGEEVFEFRDPEGRTRMMASVPFTPGTSWRIGNDSTVWYSPQTPYRVYRLSLDHDTLLRVEKEYDPVPVTSDERREQIEEMTWFTEQGGSVDASRIPGEKPALSGFLVDTSGYLWVTPSVSGTSEPASGTIFDIFDPGGRYLGPLELPVRLRTRGAIITTDRIYGVTTDELDVPYVVILGLERGGGLTGSPG